MATVDNIRNGLIDKILAIRNKEFLVALDKLIVSSSENTEMILLTEEQKLMLEMSESDIRNGKVSIQSALKNRTSEWLKKKNSQL
jgi:glutamine amidotransferase PdxT